MKVTDEMVAAFGDAWRAEDAKTDRAHGDRRRAGLQAVLDLIMPDQEQAQRVYVDGDTVTVIDRRERPQLAYGLTRGEEYRIDVEARPVPAVPAEPESGTRYVPPLEQRVEKLEQRLQGLIETNSLWDGS